MENKLTIVEAKEIYFKYNCSLFNIIRETNYIDILLSSVSKEQLIAWNDEYVLLEASKISTNDSRCVYNIYDLAQKDISYNTYLFLYDIIIKIDNEIIYKNKRYYLKFFLSFYIYSKDIFHGFIYSAYISKDYDKMKDGIYKVIELLKENDEELFDFYRYLITFNLVYNLKLDEDIYPLMKAYWMDKFNESMSYRNCDWPVVCYLTAIYVKKDYINAYRAFKLTFDKYDNDKCNLSISYLNLINKVTKLNYTIDDVINLKSFEITNPLDSDIDCVVKKLFK